MNQPITKLIRLHILTLDCPVTVQFVKNFLWSPTEKVGILYIFNFKRALPLTDDDDEDRSRNHNVIMGCPTEICRKLKHADYEEENPSAHCDVSNRKRRALTRGTHQGLCLSPR